jgi:NADH-quinone oxidoreductase subunit L
MAVVAVIGAITALYAATIALAQYDMKRILAYSTISQLGYMFLAVGVFAADSAVFHLYTHAFFKALLFLAAGSVMHAMSGVIDVRQFGGLRKALPITCITFVVGALALSGVPFFSGFFSKDEIIHAAFEQHVILGMIGLVTAVLTAFYTFRMVFLAFWGQFREPEGVHAHESGAWMLIPMILLAVGAFLAGYVGTTFHSGGFAGFLEPEGVFHEFLAPVVTPFAEAGPHKVAAAHAGHGATAGGHVMMYVSAFLAIASIVFAYLLYVRRDDWLKGIYNKVTGAHRVLNNKYYVDELNDAVIVRPLFRGGNKLFRFDQWVIDGLVWLVAAVPRAGGATLRVFQNGAIQSYGVAMTFGLVLLFLIAWLAV